MNSDKGHDEIAVEAQGAFFLSREQVKELILAAQNAWRKQTELGLTDQPFEDWRKQSLWDLICKSSFRTVNQTEFNKALDGFFILSGKRQPGHLNCSKVKSADETRRAIWRLKEECKEAASAFGGEDGAMRYANSLMEKIHKVKLGDASAKQVWQVIFTLKNRSKKHVTQASPETAQICDLRGGGEKAHADAPEAQTPFSPRSPRPF
jgi:hypothetical protein